MQVVGKSITVFLVLAAASGSLSAVALTQEDVVEIANAAASQHGYDLQKYNPPDARYQFTEKDNSWSVFYQCKGIAPPGCHFMVTVDAATKFTQVYPGK